MANYGLSLTGYVTPSAAQIRSDINTLMRARFGNGLDLGDSDPIGFLIGITAAALSTAYSANQVAWSAIDPDAATGAGLDGTSLITGTFRQAASQSIAVVTFCGADATTVPIAMGVATTSLGVKFATKVPAITFLQATWVASTAYIVGQRVTLGGRCYQCTIAGTSASSGGPTQLSGTQVDGTVTWLWIGTGVAVIDVNMYSADTGPIVAVAGDLGTITTPTANINTAYNVNDAILGSNLQTDQGLRLFRSGGLALAGGGPPNALRADLLAITGVTGVNVFYNVTDITDSNGTLPHCCNALVQGGADADIAAALFANVPVGINTTGTTSVNVLDSQGVSQAMKFTRPVTVPIFIRAGITKLNATYGGDTNMKTILATAGGARVVGADAIASALIAAAFAGDSSVIDVSQMLIYTDTINTPVAWVTTTAYVATPGARSVVLADGGRAYICTTGGTSGGTGPSGVGSAIADGSVVWAFLGNTVVINNFQLATYPTANMTIVSVDGTL